LFQKFLPCDQAIRVVLPDALTSYRLQEEEQKGPSEKTESGSPNGQRIKDNLEPLRRSCFIDE
jgi:hypothetical protein